MVAKSEGYAERGKSIWHWFLEKGSEKRMRLSLSTNMPTAWKYEATGARSRLFWNLARLSGSLEHCIIQGDILVIHYDVSWTNFWWLNTNLVICQYHLILIIQVTSTSKNMICKEIFRDYFLLGHWTILCTTPGRLITINYKSWSNS